MSELRAHLLSAFRRVSPTAAGVVLASEEGQPIAADVGPGVDAYDLARRAQPGAGALVALADKLYLVVRLPRALIEKLDATLPA